MFPQLHFAYHSRLYYFPEKSQQLLYHRHNSVKSSQLFQIPFSIHLYLTFQVIHTVFPEHQSLLSHSAFAHSDQMVHSNIIFPNKKQLLPPPSIFREIHPFLLFLYISLFLCMYFLHQFSFQITPASINSDSSNWLHTIITRPNLQEQAQRIRPLCLLIVLCVPPKNGGFFRLFTQSCQYVAVGLTDLRTLLD